MNNETTTMTANETFNGWASYETWNAALWIGNDEFLYDCARNCVRFAQGENPWIKFQRVMKGAQTGSFIGATGDGVAWDHAAIDATEMEEMMRDL
jgi:hypothetical protein